MRIDINYKDILTSVGNTMGDVLKIFSCMVGLILVLIMHIIEFVFDCVAHIVVWARKGISKIKDFLINSYIVTMGFIIMIGMRIGSIFKKI